MTQFFFGPPSVLVVCVKKTMILLAVFLLVCGNVRASDTPNPITDFSLFQTQMPVPKVVDMRDGGEVVINMGVVPNHDFGGGLTQTYTTYGYGIDGDTPTFPGPTILAKSGVPIQVKWVNTLPAPHLLADHVEPSLIGHAAVCYPDCGVPAVTHVHGLEVESAYDGSPLASFGIGQNATYKYPNSQPAGTLMYHDHAAGFTRLNVWAGMLGAYIIVDDVSADMNLLPACDIPFVMTDRILNDDGTLGYPDSEATITSTRWAPEAYGAVNLVNGVVSPFVEVPQEQCRFRLISLGNARPYFLNSTLFRFCKVIGKDAATVREPFAVPLSGLELFPAERFDLICDFSEMALGAQFDVMNTYFVDDTEAQSPNLGYVFQVRVTTPPSSKFMPIPRVTNTFGDLKALFLANPGDTKHVMLDEADDANDTPVRLNVYLNNNMLEFMHAPVGSRGLTCELGKVEMWLFTNPTPDVHPFHWHVVRAQCGPDESSIDTNVLVDVRAIPSAFQEPTTVTQVCYVACMPVNHLVDPTTSATDFGFSIAEPYLTHCHILEHEENDMMTYFYIGPKSI
eukprot:c3735_g1_i1.p1 GENE.c3735_g1_i1~~c3735_g1_i1.p1  ORF type:complete len:566 (+),score=148.00 c3735_g1_i1:31-1728(+)